MQGTFGFGEQSLPGQLQSDLEELLTWDNNCALTWSSLEGETDETHWFRAELRSNGREFGLRLKFWIPEWMGERGVAAILPAHLQVEECAPGRHAAVSVGMGKWSALETSVPKVARTCARLINELWGSTDGDDVLLVSLDYLEEQLETPFQKLPTYGK
ncbi:MAG TPA: hypothetical protein VFU47_12830 [Armatimonadota bacterium]|nr:hypothetical protein [Armatimonadota bacterium]